MTIETKYNLNDKVWTIDGNRVICFEIEHIHVESNIVNNVTLIDSTTLAQSISRSIFYKGANTDIHRECECFPTKQELIKFLSL